MRDQEGPHFVVVVVVVLLLLLLYSSGYNTNVACFFVESLIPMDTRLVKDDTDEDDDKEEEDEPTIKLKLDLGNVNDNLLFQLLAPDDEVQQQPSSIMETTTTTTTTTNIKSTAETIVSNLLQATEKEISTVRKKQKVLIEELP